MFGMTSMKIFYFVLESNNNKKQIKFIYSSNLSSEEKQKIFEMRMVDIPEIFGNLNSKCICGDHIYSCKVLKQSFNIP